MVKNFPKPIKDKNPQIQDILGNSSKLDRNKTQLNTSQLNCWKSKQGEKS